MKKTYAILFILCISNFCFAYSDVTRETLKKAWDLATIYEYQDAIDLVTNMLNDPATENRERVHYHIARSQFFSMNMDTDAQSYDMIILGNLIRKYPECMEEKIKYYILFDEY